MYKSIGNIGNYYGRLLVKEKGTKFYWGVGNLDDVYWEEIPEFLYKALIRFETKRLKAEQTNG